MVVEKEGSGGKGGERRERREGRKVREVTNAGGCTPVWMANLCFSQGFTTLSTLCVCFLVSPAATRCGRSRALLLVCCLLFLPHGCCSSWLLAGPLVVGGQLLFNRGLSGGVCVSSEGGGKGGATWPRMPRVSTTRIPRAHEETYLLSPTHRL